jgi:hypothetical protein
LLFNSLQSYLDSIDRAVERINWSIQNYRNDATFNATAGAAFVRAGLSWDKEFDKLLNLLTKNGSIPNFKSRPIKELETDTFVWTRRLSMSVAISLYKVSETHLR